MSSSPRERTNSPNVVPRKGPDATMLTWLFLKDQLR